MGSGVVLSCACGTVYEVSLGIGMMFPSVYRETLEAAEKGQYGIEWQQLVSKTKYIAIDAERYLFYCEKCGFWEVQYGLSLYKPKSVERLVKKQYGIKTVEEWGYIPYATISDFEIDYVLLKEYKHNCPMCKHPMKKISSLSELNHIKIRCKDCGNLLQIKDYIMWD